MQEEQKKSSRKKPQSFLGELFEWVKILLVAGIAAFLLNNYVIANSTIPTGSMENTIMAGSRVFGSRLHYRFGTVERGDVAIFLYGYQCRNDHQTGEVDAGMIKKLAVQSSSGKVPVGTVYINGEAITESYLPEPMIVDGSQFPEVDVTVPEGSYFMMGDNRNNSADARFWGENQFVKREKMLAKVYLCYWPLNRAGVIH